jgi:hypothetical protein
MKKVKFSIFILDQDEKIVSKKADEIIPMLDGLTPNQVKRTFEKIKGIIDESISLKFEYHR